MNETGSKYKVGDAVMVAIENPSGNPRTPHYIRGKRGVIGAVHGVLENIRDHRGVHKPLYTVKFDLSELFSCHDQDSIWVDVHEEWLSARGGIAKRIQRQICSAVLIIVSNFFHISSSLKTLESMPPKPH